MDWMVGAVGIEPNDLSRVKGMRSPVRKDKVVCLKLASALDD